MHKDQCNLDFAIPSADENALILPCCCTLQTAHAAYPRLEQSSVLHHMHALAQSHPSSASTCRNLIVSLDTEVNSTTAIPKQCGHSTFHRSTPSNCTRDKPNTQNHVYQGCKLTACLHIVLGRAGAILRLCHDDQGGSLHWHLQDHQNHCFHADCTAQSQARLLQQKVPASSQHMGRVSQDWVWGAAWQRWMQRPGYQVVSLTPSLHLTIPA